MVGARAREVYDRLAKERMKARKGNQPGATKENVPDLSIGRARDQAGKAVGVSGRTYAGGRRRATSAARSGCGAIGTTTGPNGVWMHSAPPVCPGWLCSNHPVSGR